jgi:hypothetical protein
MFRLTATQLYDSVNLKRALRPRRYFTISLPLPKHAAIVLEIEHPSKDAFFFALFLISIMIVDGVLTRWGVLQFDHSVEGNPLMRFLIEHLGLDSALLLAKAVAIGFVLGLTVAARRIRWIKNTIAVLCWVYLICAILPWAYLLYIS